MMTLNSRVVLSNIADLGCGYDEKYNPKDVQGTIINLNGKYYPVIVLWDNGIRNSYNFKNLEKI